MIKIHQLLIGVLNMLDLLKETYYFMQNKQNTVISTNNLLKIN